MKEYIKQLWKLIIGESIQKRENIVLTHLLVDSFGWENTVYLESDFDTIQHTHIINNKEYEFTAYIGGKNYVLKGYYDRKRVY